MGITVNHAGLTSTPHEKRSNNHEHERLRLVQAPLPKSIPVEYLPFCNWEWLPCPWRRCLNSMPFTMEPFPSPCTRSEGILNSHSLSSLLNYLRAFGDGPVAGVPGGQGIQSWLACLEFEPSATKKTRRVGQRCTLNLSRAEMSYRCFEVISSNILLHYISFKLAIFFCDHGSLMVMVMNSCPVFEPWYHKKFSVEEELMHVKHVEVKSTHVGVMWKFGRSYQLRYRPRHLTAVQNYVVARQ
ncbi:hypothetical protein TNCV_4026461 [Trichonephila clavipes]|nr:hypothetical protein TNCV_4026461 [Trichonephila clavipes]